MYDSSRWAAIGGRDPECGGDRPAKSSGQTPAKIFGGTDERHFYGGLFCRHPCSRTAIHQPGASKEKDTGDSPFTAETGRGTYRRFLEQLWPYQFTPQQTPLTEKLANKLFDFSGGIPAYIIKIFQETQAQALLLGQARINERVMQRAIDILAIKVPRTYSGGTYLSDFEIDDTEMPDVETSPAPSHEQAPGDAHGETPETVPRLYANQRGRRAASRDAQDLVAAFAAGGTLIDFLRENDLMEEWPVSC